MSKQDLVSAAMLQLRAKIHESYAMLEAAVDAAPTESSAETIATAAVRLSQWEHAAASLQRQIENLIPAEEPTTVEVEEFEDEEAPEPLVVNEDNSPTFKRSQKYRNISTQESDES